MPPDGWETDCLAAVGCGPSDRCLSRSGWKWLFFYGSFLPPPLPLSLSFLNGFSVLGRRRRWQRESVRRVANTTIVSCGGRARPRRRRLAGCPPGCVHHSPGRGRCRRICGERERERERRQGRRRTLPHITWAFLLTRRGKCTLT